MRANAHEIWRKSDATGRVGKVLDKLHPAVSNRIARSPGS
jgi:hypothetical protein